MPCPLGATMKASGVGAVVKWRSSKSCPLRRVVVADDVSERCHRLAVQAVQRHHERPGAARVAAVRRRHEEAVLRQPVVHRRAVRAALRARARLVGILALLQGRRRRVELARLVALRRAIGVAARDQTDEAIAQVRDALERAAPQPRRGVLAPGRLQRAIGVRDRLARGARHRERRLDHALADGGLEGELLVFDLDVFGAEGRQRQDHLAHARRDQPARHVEERRRTPGAHEPRAHGDGYAERRPPRESDGHRGEIAIAAHAAIERDPGHRSGERRRVFQRRPGQGQVGALGRREHLVDQAGRHRPTPVALAETHHEGVVARLQIEGDDVVVVAREPPLVAREDGLSVDVDAHPVVDPEEQVVAPALRHVQDPGGVRDEIVAARADRAGDVDGAAAVRAHLPAGPPPTPPSSARPSAGTTAPTRPPDRGWGPLNSHAPTCPSGPGAIATTSPGAASGSAVATVSRAVSAAGGAGGSDGRGVDSAPGAGEAPSPGAGLAAAPDVPSAATTTMVRSRLALDDASLSFPGSSTAPFTLCQSIIPCANVFASSLKSTSTLRGSSTRVTTPSPNFACRIRSPSWNVAPTL